MYQQYFPTIKLKLKGSFNLHDAKTSLSNALVGYALEGKKCFTIVCRAYDNTSFNKVRFTEASQGYVNAEFISPRPIPHMIKPNLSMFAYMPQGIKNLWKDAFGLLFRKPNGNVRSVVALANYILSFNNFIQNKDSLNIYFDINDYTLLDNHYIIETFGENYFNNLKEALNDCLFNDKNCGDLNVYQNGLESRHLIFDGYSNDKLLYAIESKITNALSRCRDVPSTIETLFTILALQQDKPSNGGNNIKLGLTAMSLYRYMLENCPIVMADKETKEILRQLDHYILSHSISCSYMLDVKTKRWLLCYYPNGIESMPLLRLAQLAYCVYKSINDKDIKGAAYKDIFGELMEIVEHDCYDIDLNYLLDAELTYTEEWHLSYKIPDGRRYDLLSRLIVCGLFQNYGETVGIGESDEHPNIYSYPRIKNAEAVIKGKVVEAYTRWQNSGYHYSYAYPVLNLYFTKEFKTERILGFYKAFLNTARHILYLMGNRKDASMNLIMNFNESNELYDANRSLQPYVISPSINGDYGYFVRLQHTNSQLFNVKLYTTRAQVIVNLMQILYYRGDVALAKSYVQIISPFLKQYDPDTNNISTYIGDNTLRDSHNEVLYGMIMKYIDVLLQ